jgi:hypothetical protein
MSGGEKFKEEKKISRRAAVSAAAKVAGAAAAGLVIGGVAGYLLKPEAPPNGHHREGSCYIDCREDSDSHRRVHTCCSWVG